MNTAPRFVGYIISTFILCLPIVWWTLTGLGYHVNAVGWQVAEIAVEKRSVGECDKMIRLVPDIFSPTLREQKWMCITGYAEKMQDASVCESILESPYGSSCISHAKKQNTCKFYEDYKVSWAEADKAFTFSLSECQKIDPSISTLAFPCCRIATVSYLVPDNDCSSLKNNHDLFDECQYSTAYKNRNPDFCSTIYNSNTRIACELHSKLLKEFPSKCEYCDKLIYSISEIAE